MYPEVSNKMVAFKGVLYQTINSKPFNWLILNVEYVKWKILSKKDQKNPENNIISDNKNKKKPKIIEALTFLVYRPINVDSVIISENHLTK